MWWSNLEGPAKGVAICATVFLVAGGLCGLQVALLNGSGSGGGSLVVVFIITGIIELGAMLVSALLLVVLAIAWVVQAIRGERPEPAPGIHTPFAASDEDKDAGEKRD